MHQVRGTTLLPSCVAFLQSSLQETTMVLTEYKPGTAFPGETGRTMEESQPAWPAPVRAKKGVPNVLFIVLDDTGFGQLGCYGSPIKTPNFRVDRVQQIRSAVRIHRHDLQGDGRRVGQDDAGHRGRKEGAGEGADGAAPDMVFTAQDAPTPEKFR
ncbi:hypothetical protein [Noviherbaspirillum cavernae]|uniref:hypothetical protein n=1 Tax=Noviherbaspirillum cavernae TaxID=2320862 RepID=UPI0018F78F6B|nr:hypothetical protein [Noviherbaspirillum cavernae]